MKIAVISDIHANLHALTSVILDFQEREVDKVFALGDYAMAGAQPVETMQFVLTQSWEMIQGNTDELIANYNDEIYELVKNNFPVMGEALKYDVNVLPLKYREFLKNLPKEKLLEVEGVKIHLVHGSPRKNNENIYPNLPLEKVEEMCAPSSADLILCGHTHIPCGYQLESKKTVINVGSVGRPMTDNVMPCYLLLDIKNGEFTAEHVFVDYDRDTVANIIRNHPYDGAEKLAGMLYSTKEKHI